MKKMIYSLAIAAILLCTACSNNKDNDETNTTPGSYPDTSGYGDTSGTNMIRDTLRR